MPGPKYKLTYFPVKGRGELIRMIFHAARVPFEDRRIPFSEWPTFKTKTPAGSLPILEINGEVFIESGAIANWAARKFGLMGKTDAEQLKTEAVLIQVVDFRETYFVPLVGEKDPEKTEALKKELLAGVDKVFTKWEANVVQTESTGRKVFSYMITQSMTVADLALLYVADLIEDYVQLDWSRFPRLQAVIKTLTDLPHLKAYLALRDNPDASKTPRSQDKTPRSRDKTPRAEATSKEHATSGSTKPMTTPRNKATPRHNAVKQKA